MTQDELLKQIGALISRFENSNDIIVGAYLDVSERGESKSTIFEWNGAEFRPSTDVVIKVKPALDIA